MWSLCTEVAFYLLLPVLCRLLVRGATRDGRPYLPAIFRRAVVLGVLGVAWQAVVAQIPGHEGHYAQWLPGYLPWFLVGMCFAALSASLAGATRGSTPSSGWPGTCPAAGSSPPQPSRSPAHRSPGRGCC